MTKTNRDKSNLVDFLADTEAGNGSRATLERATIQVSKPPVTKKPVEVKKGRRSYRKPGVAYERVSVDIPSTTKELLDLARIKSGSPHAKKHQATIVDEALLNYLRK
jgi:biotin synthase-related radical SAM superfamily protein